MHSFQFKIFNFHNKTLNTMNWFSKLMNWCFWMMQGKVAGKMSHPDFPLLQLVNSSPFNHLFSSRSTKRSWLFVPEHNVLFFEIVSPTIKKSGFHLSSSLCVIIVEGDLEGEIEGDSKGDFRGDFKQDMEGEGNDVFFPCWPYAGIEYF